MNPRLTNPAPRLAAAWLLAATIACSGCGGDSAEAVDPAMARQTLASVLDGWKSGDPCSEWQARSPKIVVQDFDWQAGLKLKSYEIMGEGDPRDANLYCQVRLMLADPARGDVQKTVTYVVGTDPVLTVFRAMM
jgi:hypothetical protein